MNKQLLYVVTHNYVDTNYVTTKYADWVASSMRKNEQKTLPKISEYPVLYSNVVAVFVDDGVAKQFVKKSGERMNVKQLSTTSGPFATTTAYKITGHYHCVQAKECEVVTMPDGNRCAKFDNIYVVLNEKRATTDDTQSEMGDDK